MLSVFFASASPPRSPLAHHRQKPAVAARSAAVSPGIEAEHSPTLLQCRCSTGCPCCAQSKHKADTISRSRTAESPSALETPRSPTCRGTHNLLCG